MKNDITTQEFSQEEITHHFKGVWFPAEIWMREDLSWMEKLLFIQIDSLSSAEKGCFASNKYFCKLFKIEERQLQRMLANLKKTNLIEVISFDGRKRILRTLKENIYKVSPRELSPLGCHKCHPTGVINVTPERSTHNNIYTKINNSPSENINARAIRGAKPPFDPPKKIPKQEKIKFRENVSLTQKEYDTLVEKDGKEVVEQMLDKLDSYKGSRGEEYKSDYYTMKEGGWVRKEIMKHKDKEKVVDLVDIPFNKAQANYFENSFNQLDQKIKRGRTVTVLSQGLEFSTNAQGGNGVTLIEYKNPKFKEMVIHMIEKWGLKGLI